jgi:hypothetical protein
MAPSPKRAWKTWRERKRAQKDESQPISPIEGVDLRNTSYVSSASATRTNELPKNKPIIAIEIVSTDLDNRLMPWPPTTTAMDFKSKLEAKDMIIAHLQEDV